MWTDKESEVDYLNFSEIAEVTSEMLLQKQLLPLSLGVYGGWGAGKSTVLNLIKGNLASKIEAKEVVLVEFDAWLYQDFDDARSALLDIIASKLVDAIKDDETLVGKVKNLLKRINYLRVLGMAADVGLFMSTGIAAGPVSSLMATTNRVVSGIANGEEVRESVSGTAGLVKDIVKDNEKFSPSQEVYKFREEFKALMEELGKVLVVFIDNLDRCLPKKAIQTLEAVRQFLFLPWTSFVIAADEDMIRHAVREHYSGPNERLINDYLDKMVQVSIRVPFAGSQEVLAYMMLLYCEEAGLEQTKIENLRLYIISKLRKVWKNEKISLEDAVKILGVDQKSDLCAKFDMAYRLAPILVRSTNVMGNPRIVKRLLNTVSIRSKIAKQRDMALDNAVITKVAILERCMGGDNFAKFCNKVNSSDDGIYSVLEELEQCVDDADVFSSKCPEYLSKNVPFLTAWCSIEPLLGNVDLRPVIYLSRDAAPIKVTSDKLSMSAEEALDILLSIKSTNSPNATKISSKLSNDEAELVMNKIIVELNKVADWSKFPQNMNGAMILAKAQASTQPLLSRFINTIPLIDNKGWLKFLKDKNVWLSKE